MQQEGESLTSYHSAAHKKREQCLRTAPAQDHFMSELTPNQASGPGAMPLTQRHEFTPCPVLARHPQIPPPRYSLCICIIACFKISCNFFMQLSTRRNSKGFGQACNEICEAGIRENLVPGSQYGAGLEDQAIVENAEVVGCQG